MSAFTDHINELKAGEAFSRQSEVFDALYNEDPVIIYKRERVRRHILNHLNAPGSLLLELNCGTGEDALYFARQGHRVHATDISEGMLQKLWLKKQSINEGSCISTELRSFTDLENLTHKGPYDVIYSNFGGLNCTQEIKKVLYSFRELVKPGGTITLVVISRFCLWEFLLLFRGKLKTAFRRFFSRKGRKAKVEGRNFTCWYYGIGDVRKNMPPGFQITETEALCTIVPPSYIEGFAQKRPSLFHWLKRKEDRFKSRWPWVHFGDYLIITLKKQAD